MTNETLRMQMLAGIITEGEYKAKLQESLWDRIKDTPKAWIAKIKGGASAIMASALSDGGFKIGVPVYAYDDGELSKLTLKSVNYNTGISDVIYEKSLDGGKNWKTDEKESLKTKLGLDQDLSSLLKKTPEERKTWYDQIVKDIKDNFTTKDVSYNIEDLKPDTPKEKPEWKSNKYIDTPSLSLDRMKELGLKENKKKPLKEHFIGMGAINSPFIERKKETYEDAFEHFLGGKYGLNEEEAMEEGELARGEEYKLVQDGNYWILTYIDKGRINTPEVTEKFRSKEEADKFYKEHLEVVAKIAKDFADARASGDPRAQQPF
jgi:hypothetical protein